MEKIVREMEKETKEIVKEKINREEKEANKKIGKEKMEIEEIEKIGMEKSDRVRTEPNNMEKRKEETEKKERKEMKEINGEKEKTAVEIRKEHEKMSEFTRKYILFEKTKVLYTIIYPKLNLFPKSEKFTLRQRIEELILDSIKLLIKQNYKTNDSERRELMLEYIANMELLIYLVQQSAVFRYISLDIKDNLERLLKELIAMATARYKNLGFEKKYWGEK